MDVAPAQPERRVRVRASSWRDRQPRDEPASSSQPDRPLGEWRDKPASSRVPAEPVRRGKKRGHEDDEARFDELARTVPKKGDRQALQIPTEVWRSRAGGRLLLGALPTEANKDKFPPVALQITVMAQHPWSRGGVVLPGALHRQWQITSGSHREREFQSLWPLVKHTLWEGQQVLAHCMAGRHRGASAAEVLRSLLSGESLEASEAAIQSQRDIELWQVRRQNKDLAEWMLRVVRVTKLGTASPLPVAYVATENSLLHCQHKNAKGARKLSSPMRTSDKFEAFAWLGESCTQCFSMAGAKWQAP